MVGSSHEALHRIFQKDPALLTRALQQVLHVPFPEPREIAALLALWMHRSERAAGGGWATWSSPQEPRPPHSDGEWWICSSRSDQSRGSEA